MSTCRRRASCQITPGDLRNTRPVPLRLHPDALKEFAEASIVYAWFKTSTAQPETISVEHARIYRAWPKRGELSGAA